MKRDLFKPNPSPQPEPAPRLQRPVLITVDGEFVATEEEFIVWVSDADPNAWKDGGRRPNGIVFRQREEVGSSLRKILEREVD
jgi:hypothetical protein